MRVICLFLANKEQYDLKMSLEAAQHLYTGIIADSGRFLYDNTTTATLGAASFLYDCGIDRNKIHELLYQHLYITYDNIHDIYWDNTHL